MPITYEAIKSANERVGRIEISRRDKKTGQVITKHYACVAERVQAFREICPMGSITTEISFRDTTDGKTMCICKATVCDDCAVLATGHAYEIEGSTQINSTSYLENAETSAIGRALAVLGLGSENSMASAEEMANALYQQDCKAFRAEKLAEIVQVEPDEDEKARKVAVDIVNMLYSKSSPELQAEIDKRLAGKKIEDCKIEYLRRMKVFITQEQQKANEAK